MTLSSSQKRELRRQAHKLHPVVIIGHKGLTDAVQHEIDHALFDHELIKVKINAETREDRAQICAAICTAQKADAVQIIGHIAVIYRHNPEFKKKSTSL